MTTFIGKGFTLASNVIQSPIWHHVGSSLDKADWIETSLNFSVHFYKESTLATAVSRAYVIWLTSGAIFDTMKEKTPESQSRKGFWLQFAVVALSAGVLSTIDCPSWWTLPINFNHLLLMANLANCVALIALGNPWTGGAMLTLFVLGILYRSDFMPKPVCHAVYIPLFIILNGYRIIAGNIEDKLIGATEVIQAASNINQKYEILFKITAFAELYPYVIHGDAKAGAALIKRRFLDKLKGARPFPTPHDNDLPRDWLLNRYGRQKAIQQSKYEGESQRPPEVSDIKTRNNVTRQHHHEGHDHESEQPEG